MGLSTRTLHALLDRRTGAAEAIALLQADAETYRDLLSAALATTHELHTIIRSQRRTIEALRERSQPVP